MSVLLTPPNSSHRGDKEKENKYPPVAGPSTRTVVWAPEDSIHCLGTTPKASPFTSRSRPKATKSILKKSSQPNLLPLPETTQEREVTPEPKDPLVDLAYLEHPVDQILTNGNAEEGSLRQLIEGYSILAARLRASVADSTDADASWPIFQPLRKNSEAFVDAVVRDLGRALVDPLSYRADGAEKDAKDVPECSLPSPQKSPTKKKGGLSAEQVKFARDLCTTSHAVIKLLYVVLSVKAIYSVFDEKQLGRILTAALAIPLADELPTPNARKTCALAIFLLQLQRLPAEVLKPAADRIAYAIRRGLDGELGKEGKKGSANDGLKAIHDLSMYLPDVFVPAFTPLLPSILCNLLANTFNLRTQACHALGGFVYASTKLPLSPIHTKIAATIAAFVTTVAPEAPKPPGSQSPPRIPEASIVRTLRTTLICTDPIHVAQGPVWGLSVLASFAVGLGSRLYEDLKTSRIVTTLISVGLRHKKSSVRSLCCATWRPIIWAYFQPPLPADPDEGEEEVDKEASKDKMTPAQVRGAYLKVVKSLLDRQAGISTVAAFLAKENGGMEEDALRQALEILEAMSRKDGEGCGDVEDALRHMTSLPSPSRDEVEPWDPNLLLPKSLFSSFPGLLTAEYKGLKGPIQEVYNQMAMVRDIRYLTTEEMSRPWVFEGLLRTWRVILGRLEMFDETEVPECLVQTWSNLLRANVRIRRRNDEDADIIQFACTAVTHLINIASHPTLDFRPRKVSHILSVAPGDSDDTVPDIDGPATLTNAELRMRVVHRLWGVMKTVIPHKFLGRSAELLLDGLVKSRLVLVPECSRLDGSFNGDDLEGPRNCWVALCMDVLGMCYPGKFKAFWGCDMEEDSYKWEWKGEFTRAVWKTSVDIFMDGSDQWRDGVVLLGLPFSDRHAWVHSSEDYNAWEELLAYTSSKALDDGLDTINVLDRLASFVSHFQTAGMHPAPSMRLVDFMFTHINADEMSELPSEVLELASTTMRTTYPPEPRNKQIGMWMVRSLMAVIEHCPVELCLRMLQSLEEGLCLWLADECQTWTEDELNYDIIPLYQHILVRIQALPESLPNLRVLENILDSVFTKRVLPAPVEAFKDYWTLTYSRMPEPESGWPETIVHCLRAVGILPQPEPVASTSTSPLAPAFALPLPVPRTPTSSSFTTPSTANIKIVSPERPQKVFPSFPIVPTTPISPVRSRRSSSSSTRTPLSAIQLCNTPAKRRRLMSDGESDAEKENMVVCSPVSVADRIAGLGKVNGKKRQLEEEDGEGVQPTPSKKLKSKMKPKGRPLAKRTQVHSPAASAASSNESEDERWVQSALLPASPRSKLRSPSSSPKAPRFRTYAGRSRASLPNTFDPPTPLSAASKERNHSTILDRPETPTKKIDLTKVQFRRSISFPESLLAAVANKKRKRVDSLSEQEEHEDHAGPSSSRPLRPLKRAYTVPSSDSDISIHSMSSDDDPHVGQVTPHHLVSPALNRRSILDGLAASASTLSAMKDLFGDSPESDDSGVSESDTESPTKEFVSRQLQRMGSDSRLSRTLPTSS
ncbi:hypothetical protein CVT26_013350 [Gymnopilus dilepis]|uniref:Telomere-associated protein Rif1 N-terminal domain-containing protein n=1 Tax=Gymnopilus dilepis TaxID=231916 RepID=A0A409WDF6_9AGAR|nr:hypothetical protein CVT26_013350 [Gymnopilus dilepis]